MDKDQLMQKKFLEEQLQWTVEQARILDKIHEKLHEMKRIAEYASQYELTSYEREKLNERLRELEEDVHDLEGQLRSVAH